MVVTYVKYKRALFYVRASTVSSMLLLKAAVFMVVTKYVKCNHFGLFRVLTCGRASSYSSCSNVTVHKVNTENTLCIGCVLELFLLQELWLWELKE